MATYSPLPPQLTLPPVGAQPKQIAPWLPGAAPSQQPGYIGQANPDAGQGFLPGAGMLPAGNTPPQLQSSVKMVPGFGPINSGYIDAFNATLAPQRAAIDRQLQQALGELGQRRDAAAKIIAGMPGEIATNTATGTGALAAAAQAGAAGLDKGAGSPVSAGQLGSALVAAGSGAGSASKYAGLANMANSQGGEALLRQQALAGNQQLDQEQAQFMQGLIMQQAAQRAGDDAYARHAAIDEGYRQKDFKAQSAATAQQQADANAAQYGLTSAAQLKEIEATPAFQYAVKALSTGTQGFSQDQLNTLAQLGMDPDQVNGKMTAQQIVKKYAANPELLKALAANGYLPMSDLSGAGFSAFAAPTKAPGK